MTPELIRATAELVWFFETGIPSFERSNWGAALERYANLAASRQKFDRDAVTAWPSKSSQFVSQAEPPDDSTLIRYGEVSRRLHRVALADPQAARALGLAFGAEGAKWARSDRGRMVALFPLIPAGIALVARARRHSRGDLTLSDADRLRVEVTVDSITSGRDATRRRLIIMASAEATDLLAHALRVWMRVK